MKKIHWPCVGFSLLFLLFHSATEALEKSDTKQARTTGKGNTTLQSFNKAKKTLEREVYPSHRLTLYCGAKFDAKNNIIPLSGFSHPKYKTRQRQLEWEHVVPAEHFGRTFSEWRDGHKECVDKKGNRFRGEEVCGEDEPGIPLHAVGYAQSFPSHRCRECPAK